MREYLRLKEAAKGGLGKVTFDASVDYARKGEPLAADLYSLFPWIKIVMIMREPISRVISYSRMYTERGHGEKGCFHDSPLYDCLQPFFGKFKFVGYLVFYGALVNCYFAVLSCCPNYGLSWYFFSAYICPLYFPIL